MTKKDELDMFLENYGHNLPKYVCITEHFLNSNNIELFSLKNYNVISSNSRSKMKRGGSLIMGRNECIYEELQICKKLYKMIYFEVCGVRDKVTNINICCIYRNDDRKFFENFMEQLEKLLEHFFNKHCIICGDFNVDLLKDNEQRAQFLSLLKCYNFRTLISSMTYSCRNAESCLDNFLTNLPETSVTDIGIEFNGLSDGHAGLFCSVIYNKLDRSKNLNKCIVVKRRVFNRKNNDTFRDQVIGVKWENLGVNDFLDVFNGIYRNSFQSENVRIKENCDSKLKWITRGIKKSSQMKRFLMSSDSATNHETVITYKNNYIRVYRNVIKAAKKKSVQSAIHKSKNSSKAIWQVVNKHRNKKTSNGRDKIVLEVNNKIVEKTQEIVEVFSSKFCADVGLPSKGDINKVRNILQENTNNVLTDMRWEYITPLEILSIIKNMEKKKSTGTDEIPISVFKDNIDILAVPLAIFYNNCYEEGIFPEQLKLAKVIPVYKKGSKSDPQNYRPISLLSVLSKIFEKLIKSRLLKHLKNNNIINERQYGYQTNKGTDDAIDRLVDDVVISMNNKRKVAGLFLDLSSAFDTVGHEILLNKLERYGIRDKVLQLLRSYLENRKLLVEMRSIENSSQNVYRSNLAEVERGVPQGSVLGPIFFSIFMNDLIDCIGRQFSDVGVVVFADDTSAIISATNIMDLESKVNAVLGGFRAWFAVNSLHLNMEKTQVMLFKTTSRNRESLNVNLDGVDIKNVDWVKFLGVRVDCNLNWREELKAIENSVGTACYALRSLRDEVTLKHLTMVYYSLVESRLRYSIKFWGQSFAYNVKKAFVVQKRAIRTMVRIPSWQSCREYFIKLNILTVPCLYILVLLTDVVKHPEKYETHNERINRQGTRRKDLTKSIVPTLRVVKHSTRIQTVKLYNSLPKDLKSINDVQKFKRLLKKFLLEKCFYDVNELISTRSS